MVVPDLLDTTYRVVLAGVAAARTAAGSVESSTWNRGYPGATPSTVRSTSGARLDPPMPSNTTSVMVSRLTDSANVRSRSSESAISIGELIQPRRVEIFCCTPGSLLQADGSRCQSAPAACSALDMDALMMSFSGPGVSRSDC